MKDNSLYLTWRQHGIVLDGKQLESVFLITSTVIEKTKHLYILQKAD